MGAEPKVYGAVAADDSDDEILKEAVEYKWINVLLLAYVCTLWVFSICCYYYVPHSVEFYLYPTVGTVLIHSIKPELTE